MGDMDGSSQKRTGVPKLPIIMTIHVILLISTVTGFYLGMFFFGGGGKMVRGKCVLGRGLGPKMLVCLYPSTSSRQCLLKGKSFLNAIILNCNGQNLWGKA